MPSQTVHFAVAREYRSDGSASYYFGNIAPDYTDARAIKDIIHLRDRADRRLALTELRDQIDLSNDFEFGWLLHLYADSIWDVTVVPEFKRNHGENPAWFREYRDELGKLSRNMYKTLGWVPGIARALRAADFSDTRSMTNVLPVPLELNWFRDRILARHEAEKDNHLEIFSIDMAERFAADTAESFREFMREGKS